MRHKAGNGRRGWAARQVERARSGEIVPNRHDGRPRVLNLAEMLDIEHMAEARFQELIRRHAENEGWLYYHVLDSIGSNPGWPDTVLLDPRTFRFILAEMKTQRGRPDRDQRAWLECLRNAPAPEVYLWRPEHLGLIVEILEDPEAHLPGRRCPSCRGKGWVE